MASYLEASMRKSYRLADFKMSRKFTLLALIIPSFVVAHGGGIDNNGGHYNNALGRYQCHQAHCVMPAAPVATHRMTRASYNRTDWKHWSDFDGDCMNTRHEVLKSQSIGPIALSNKQCYVSSGSWIGLYSGKRFTLASDLDVDHIVPLKWASGHGGAAWSATKKELFANYLT